MATSDLGFGPRIQVGDVDELLETELLNLLAVLAVKHVPQPTIIHVATQHTVGGLVRLRMLGSHIEYKRNTQNYNFLLAEKI